MDILYPRIIHFISIIYPFMKKDIHLVISEELYSEIKTIADRESETISRVIINAIKQSIRQPLSHIVELKETLLPETIKDEEEPILIKKTPNQLQELKIKYWIKDDKPEEEHIHNKWIKLEVPIIREEVQDFMNEFSHQSDMLSVIDYTEDSDIKCFLAKKTPEEIKKLTLSLREHIKDCIKNEKAYTIDFLTEHLQQILDN